MTSRPYATAHTTYMSAEKMAGSLSFADVPGGVASVQTSFGMLYGEGAGQAGSRLAGSCK